MDERALIIDQAIALFEQIYVHLPLKRAMYAIDPVQRLRLLRYQLKQSKADLSFHRKMIDIFTSLHDLHTNYLLPDPFHGGVAALPFRVEAFFADGVRKYLLAGTARCFAHSTFRAGVEVHFWNGVPIARAVEVAAAYGAGSNPDASHARGLAALTARPLTLSPPPDEEWVVVGYRTAEGRDLEFRADWIVTTLPPENRVDPRAPVKAATALAYESTGRGCQVVRGNRADDVSRNEGFIYLGI